MTTLESIGRCNVKFTQMCKSARLQGYSPSRTPTGARKARAFRYVQDVGRRALVFMDHYAGYIDLLVSHSAMRVARTTSPHLAVAADSKHLVKLLEQASTTYYYALDFVEGETNDVSDMFYKLNMHNQVANAYAGKATELCDKVQDAFTTYEFVYDIDDLTTIIRDLGNDVELPKYVWWYLKLIRDWQSVVYGYLENLYSITAQMPDHVQH